MYTIYIIYVIYITFINGMQIDTATLERFDGSDGSTPRFYQFAWLPIELLAVLFYKCFAKTNNIKWLALSCDLSATW